MSKIMEAVSFDPNRPDFAPYGLTCVHWLPSPMLRPDPGTRLMTPSGIPAAFSSCMRNQAL